MEKFTLGIDIGGTNTRYGAFDLRGNYLYGNSISTISSENVQKFTVRLLQEIKKSHKEKFYKYELAGIGIAAPSVNNILGTIENPSNLEWGTVNIISLMKDSFRVPVVIINDANAAALGELKYGLAKEMKDFIAVTMGTGLGGGIVIDGKIVNGKDGLAGEFGHILVERNGRKCNCGRSGCLETYVSVNGLRRTIFQLLSESNIKSSLQNLSFSELTGEMISDYAAKGDPLAIEAFNITGGILGRALANLTACFACEAIILYGGLSKSGDLLLKPTRKYFEDNLLNIHKGKIQILKSEFENGMAAVMGANSLIMNELKVDLHSEVNSQHID
ncbi:MAG TPA: ROK family protein [Ignavibacteriaceae bacterium]|nr:ROK family protein [Ignavibacteriaceae bacterium]